LIAITQLSLICSAVWHFSWNTLLCQAQVKRDNV